MRLTVSKSLQTGLLGCDHGHEFLTKCGIRIALGRHNIQKISSFRLGINYFIKDYALSPLSRHTKMGIYLIMHN